jgi:hypothetical protein
MGLTCLMAASAYSQDYKSIVDKPLIFSAGINGIQFESDTYMDLDVGLNTSGSLDLRIAKIKKKFGLFAGGSTNINSQFEDVVDLNQMTYFQNVGMAHNAELSARIMGVYKLGKVDVGLVARFGAGVMQDIVDHVDPQGTTFTSMNPDILYGAKLFLMSKRVDGAITFTHIPGQQRFNPSLYGEYRLGKKQKLILSSTGEMDVDPNQMFATGQAGIGKRFGGQKTNVTLSAQGGFSYLNDFSTSSNFSPTVGVSLKVNFGGNTVLNRSK